MFVHTARVRLVGMPNRNRKKKELSRQRRAARRNLKFRDLLRMPCLVPTCTSCLVGMLVLMGGTIMSVVAYHPNLLGNHMGMTNKTMFMSTTENVKTHYIKQPIEYPIVKSLSYIGPVFMGFGLFVMIVAGVLYCEFVDKYVNISTDKQRSLGRRALYKIIMDQLRKNYFRGIEVPLRRRTTLTIAHAPFVIRDSTLATVPEAPSQHSLHPNVISIGIPIMCDRRLAILRKDNWCKTSSLPNITPDDDDGVDDTFDPSDPDFPWPKKYLMKKRLSKSCGNVVELFRGFGSDTLRVASSGVDNLAYLPDPERKQENTEASQTSVNSKISSEHCSTEIPSPSESSCQSLSFTEGDLGEMSSMCDSTNDSQLLIGKGGVLINTEVDSSAKKTKHVSVIVHKASVHQSDDAGGFNKLQTDVYNCLDMSDDSEGVEQPLIYVNKHDKGRPRVPLQREFSADDDSVDDSSTSSSTRSMTMCKSVLL